MLQWDTSARDASPRRGLLDWYTELTPFCFASAERTLLTWGSLAEVPPTSAQDELADRVTALLREQRCYSQSSAAVVVGAVPFEASAPCRLFIPAHVEVERGALRAGERSPRGQTEPRLAARLLRATAVPSEGGYRLAVARALELLTAGDLAKVVLARTLELQLLEPVAISALVRRLFAQNPTTYRYALHLAAPPEVQPGIFLGASPELLASRRGDVVQSNPLAGSTPRGTSPSDDRDRAERLLRSEKDRREHALVAEFVADTLQPFCRDLDVPPGPSLVQTRTLWHLSTRVRGTLRDPEISSLQVALALHPTPAVCGHPGAAARRALRQLEGFERGLFAGLVGWCDASGDGDWAVAIRCAEVERSRLRLFAGAGIVAGSTPDSELRETGVKLNTLLGALNLTIEGLAALKES